MELYTDYKLAVLGVMVFWFTSFMYSSSAQVFYDIQLVDVNNLAGLNLSMYQPHEFQSLQMIIGIGHNVTIPTSGKPEYEIYIPLSGSHKKYPVWEGKADGEIDVSIQRQYPLNISQFTFTLPGPLQMCEELESSLCVKISLPEDRYHHTYDINLTNNHLCVQFTKECRLPLVDIALKDVSIRHPEGDEMMLTFGPHLTTAISLDMTIINNSSQLYIYPATIATNFIFTISFKDNSKAIVQQSVIPNMTLSSAGLGPKKELLFQNVFININGLPKSKCLELETLCITVTPGTNATYIDDWSDNNEVFIPLENGGEGQLQCPFDIEVSQFEFNPLVNIVKPGQTFKANFDVTIMNVSPYDLPSSSKDGNYELQLQFLFFSDEHLLVPYYLESNTASTLRAGLERGVPLELDNEQGNFSFQENVCLGKEHTTRLVCVTVSVDDVKNTAIYLENSAVINQVQQCTPFHDLECESEGAETLEVLPIGLICGIVVPLMLITIIFYVCYRRIFPRIFNQDGSTGGIQRISQQRTGDDSEMLDPEGYETTLDSLNRERPNLSHSNPIVRCFSALFEHFQRLDTPNSERNPPPLPPRNQGNKGRKVVAILSYQASVRGILSFQEWDIIKVLEESSIYHGWWQGKLNGIRGSFLPSQVRELPLRLDSLNYVVMVEIDYATGTPGEINLRRGDIVKNVVITGEHDKLWEGEVNGRRGLFPRSQVKIVDNQPSFASASGNNEANQLNEQEYDVPCTSEHDLRFNPSDLPDGVNKQNVLLSECYDEQFIQSIHSTYSNDWEMLSPDIWRLDIHRKSSDICFKKKIKMIIPRHEHVDLDVRRERRVVYSTLETPSWRPIWISSYSDYRSMEPANLTTDGSSLIFSTVKVGIFAFLIKKVEVKRCLFVCMKPVDANDSVILTVYVVSPNEIQHVEEEAAKHGSYKCTNSKVVAHVSPNSKAEVEINITGNDFVPKESKKVIDFKELCLGDASSHVQVTVNKKLPCNRPCRSIGGIVKVSQGTMTKEINFHSHNIQQEIHREHVDPYATGDLNPGFSYRHQDTNQRIT
ncbi:uncharacterized protein [Amphiura filiformis]|uniref:uncharacterized protein n=1 Tax=Amphiura filiformis TaxID=82378 RepID=UPI003B228A5C